MSCQRTSYNLPVCGGAKGGCDSQQLRITRPFVTRHTHSRRQPRQE